MGGPVESTRLLNVNEAPIGSYNLVELFINTDDRFPLKCFRFICLILGPLVMVPFMFGILDDGNIPISRCAGVTLWMAIWWMSEATSITITSLLPLVLFPMFGLLSPTAVAKAYFSDLSFLLIGTICFSISMAKWNLHKRFALKILTIVGTRPSAVLFGFMFCTYFTSWWLQNTATTVMMLPVARAVLESINASASEGSSSKLRLQNPQSENRGDMKRFSTAILLAVAYSSSIGGLATLTGTGTNLVFAAQVRNLFPKYGEVSFAWWMAYCVPLSFFLLMVMWVIFYIRYTRTVNVYINSSAIRKKYNEMGPMTFEEIMVGILLFFTIALWILRNPPGCDETEGCGWEELFHPYREWYKNSGVLLSDTTAALFTALFLFFIPAKNTKKPGSKLLEWEEAQAEIPWEILLLIGSGLALAEAFAVNDFNDYVASKLTGLDGLSPYLLVFLINMAITTLTEFTSNTAVASITLPVIASLAVAIRVNPFFLMMPTVVACSFAFCLPVSTPPNAMVASSGGVRVPEMLKTGIWINIGAVLLNLGWLAAGHGILGIDLNKFPSWAEPTM